MAVQTTEEFKNGGATSYAITIEYLKASDIKVRIDGALQTYVASSPGSGQYTVSGTTVTLGAQAASGTGNVHIYRETDVDTAAAVFVAGSSIKAADLNAIHDMARFGLSEARSTTIESDIKDGAITSAKIKDGTIVNADVNASAAIDGTKISPNFGSQNIVTSGTVDGRDVSVDGTKLDGIESGATADQTAAEIKTLIGNATDSNVYTDAEKTKLSGIETGAEVNPTNAETKSAYEANSNTNAFTDAEKTKLSGIETAATADQTGAEIKSAYEGEGNTNAFTDAEKTKLSNIETSATADQTGAEIKTAYEAESNTNAFTDAEKTKLSGIATGADVTSSNSINALTDVNTSGVADGKILKYQASSSSFIIADDGGSGSGGASAFTGLSDTPANYGSAANKTLKVNSAGDAIEFVTVATDVVDDTTPQLGGNLDVQTNEITTSTTNGNIKLTPDGTGKVEIKGNGTNDAQIVLNCGNNSHGQTIKAPAHSYGVTNTFTLPTSNTSTLGSSGAAIRVNQSGQLLFDTNSRYTIGEDIYVTASGKKIILGQGNVIEFDSDNTNTEKITFQGPNSLTSTSNFTLPEDGSAGQFLKTDGSGVLSFGTVTTDIVGDTTPQLGGNLDLNGNDISGTGNFSINGNLSANSLTTNAGNLIINSQTPQISFVDSDANPDYQIKVNGGEFDIRDSTNSASRLKIGTTGEVTSQGKLNCQAGLDTDGDVVFNSDTTNVGITFDASTSNLNLSDSQSLSFGDHSTFGDYNLSYVNGSDFNILGQSGGSGDLVLGTYALGTTTKTLVSKRSNNALELYFANSKKLETVTGGVTVTGTCTATSFAGDGSNLTGISTSPTADTGGAIFQNSQTISADHTIPVGSNGMSAGPVTVNNNITLTISNGSTYTVV